MDETLRRDIGLFRYGLIADLIHPAPDEITLSRRIRDKANQEYRIPGTLRTRVAITTIHDWLRAYQQGGFDALLPRERSDIGRSRSIPRDVADRLISLKEDCPAYSVRMIIEEARKTGIVPPGLELAASTVHRLLSRHGLLTKTPGEPSNNDHRRFNYEKAGHLWMSDVMHGPDVRVEGHQTRKTYLIAFLDDATRVIPYAAFSFSENTESYLPVLKTAILRRGCPQRLFVDNGAAFRSHRLEIICATLGITLIHARAYHPEAKGKIERWFRTVRMQFLPTLSRSDLRDLDTLNACLSAWVEGTYHLAPHRGLDGESPLDRWARVSDEVRFVSDPHHLDDTFLAEAKRIVQRDRTVSLNGLLYEVDASLVRETVTLRFDPAHRGRAVQVWHNGRFVQDARLVDAYANCFVKRQRPSETPTPIQPSPHTSPGTRPHKHNPPGLALRTLASHDLDQPQDHHTDNQEVS